MFSPVLKRWAILLSIWLAAPLFINAKEPAKNAPGTRTAPVQFDTQALPAAIVAPIPVSPRNLEEFDSLENPVDSETVVEQQNNPDPDTLLREMVTAEQHPNQPWEAGEYSKGHLDGKRSARGRPLWVLSGLSGTGLCICFGAAGIGLAVAVPYYPYGEDLLGKSAPYIEGYIAGYTSGTRWRNAGWATLGFAIAIAVDIALGFPITFGNFQVKMTE